MANTDPLLSAVLAYATAPSWEAARDMLTNNATQLMSDRAEQLLQATISATRVIAPANPSYSALLQDRQSFLKRARVIGVNPAWVERRSPTNSHVAADPMALPGTVEAWLNTPTYLDQRTYLAAHLELLDPLVDRLMAALIANFQGKENEKFLQASWLWLQRARKDGLDAGWQAFCQAMDIMGDPQAAERLLQTLLDWLNTNSFDEQRAFLASHPDLLNPHVDTMLESMAAQYPGQKEERFLRASLVWLQRARQSGLDAGWQAFQFALAFDQPQNI